MASVGSEAEFGQYLDIVNPENHCQENHNHSDNSYDDWYQSLVWSAGDTGHNEGAEAAVGIALEVGLQIDPTIANAAGSVVGELWKRRDMMAFAKDVAKVNLFPAMDIALASQWHNCHAFKAILRHPVEVAGWLLS
jgi:hypothetical protein